MSVEMEQDGFKSQMRNIASKVRVNLTNKYLTHLKNYIMQRAQNGYLFYTTDIVPDNICKDQLGRWFKQEKIIMTVNHDDSITVRW